MLEERKLDKSVPVPLYYQLKNIIYEEIRNGNYRVGDAIPTENELSDIFGISRTTVRQAMTEMVREGLLYRVKSKGTFVAEKRLDPEFMDRLNIFNAVITATGRTPRTVLLEQDNDAPVPAFYADKLSGSRCIYLHRRRFADDKPINHVRTWLSSTLLDTVRKRDMSSTFIFRMLAENEVTTITKVDRTSYADMANEEDAEMLGVEVGSPIHCLDSVAYDRNGNALMCTCARYRYDESRISFTVEAKD